MVVSAGRRGKRSSRILVFQERRWASVIDMPFRGSMCISGSMNLPVGFGLELCSAGQDLTCTYMYMYKYTCIECSGDAGVPAVNGLLAPKVSSLAKVTGGQH